MYPDIGVRSADEQWMNTVTRISQAVLLQTTIATTTTAAEKTGNQSEQWEDFLTNHVMGYLFTCLHDRRTHQHVCACRLTKSKSFSRKFPPITHLAVQTILYQ